MKLQRSGYGIETSLVPRPDERDERYGNEKHPGRVDAGTLPLAVAAGEEAFGGGYDECFEHGLRLIVSGVEQSLAGGAGKER